MRVHQTERRAEYGFVKTAFQRRCAKEFHRQSWRANEWPENPGKLAAQKKVAAEPCHQHTAGSGHVSELAQQLDEAQVGGDAGESDDRYMCYLDQTVSC